MSDKVCIFVVGGPDDIRSQTIDEIIAALRFSRVANDLKLYSTWQGADEVKWRALSSHTGWQEGPACPAERGGRREDCAAWPACQCSEAEF